MKTTVLEAMVIRLIGDSASYQRMLRNAAAMTSRMARDIIQLDNRLERMGQSIVRAGKNMTLAVTAPLAYLASKGVSSFSKFDQAMTEAFAKMGVQSAKVRKEMEEVAKSLAMSGKVAFSPIELAEGYQQLAGAGLNAAKSMKALPIAATFAQAGAFDLETSVRLMIGAMSSFGAMSDDPLVFAKNFQKFSDVMVSVDAHTTATVEGVARAMAADAAVSAKMYGMSLEELGAILGVFASKGKHAEEAGNLVGRSIKLLTTTFIQKKPIWQAMGIDLIDKSTGKWIAFADAIALLENKMAGMEPPEQMAFLLKLGFQKLTIKAITPLIGMSKELKRQAKLYGHLGAAEEMAAVQMMSFANQVKVVWGHLEVLGIEIGETLAPWLLTLGKFVKKLVEGWRATTPEMKKVILLIAAMAAAIGPLLIAIGSLIWAIGKIITLFAALKIMLPVLTGLFIKLAGAVILAYGLHTFINALNINKLKEFNASLELTVKLSQQLAVIHARQRTLAIQKLANIKDPGQRKKAIEAEIADVEKQLKSYESHIRSITQDLDDALLHPNRPMKWLLGDADVKLLRKNLEDAELKAQKAREYIDELKLLLGGVEDDLTGLKAGADIPLEIDLKLTGRENVLRQSVEAIRRIEEYRKLIGAQPTKAKLPFAPGDPRNEKGMFLGPTPKGSKSPAPQAGKKTAANDLNTIGGFLGQLVSLAQMDLQRPVVTLNPSKLMDS